MDNLLYIILTMTAVCISAVLLFSLIFIKILKKQKPDLTDFILTILFFAGIYLYVPLKYMTEGYNEGKPELILKAVKLSVNPYEKRLGMYYLADIYSNDTFNCGIKDGNKAVMYMEKALKGEYEKYRGATAILALWYSIKGDYIKTKKLNDILNITKSLSLVNIYIMNNEYDNALKALNVKQNSPAEKFLAADLYKKTGDNELYEKMLKDAQLTYSKILNFQKNDFEKTEYENLILKYKTVENYREYLKEQQKEYQFAN